MRLSFDQDSVDEVRNMSVESKKGTERSLAGDGIKPIFIGSELP